MQHPKPIFLHMSARKVAVRRPPRFREDERERETRCALAGKRIQALRREKGLSPEAFAETIGATRAALEKWEAGDNVPCDKYVFAIHKLYHAPLSHLHGVKDAPRHEPTVTLTSGETLNDLLASVVRRELGGELDGAPAMKANRLDGGQMVQVLVGLAREDIQRWNRAVAGAQLDALADHFHAARGAIKGFHVATPVGKAGDILRTFSSALGREPQWPKLRCFAPLTNQRRRVLRALREDLPFGALTTPIQTREKNVQLALKMRRRKSVIDLTGDDE